ncbi:MAG: hypothetical protein VR72_20955 [Clostridiaceae bacterium BRH_c20a]|nr:MAG: hypothetical protein VR72_20955 [Clostridiaceae bacterium BRH_c20a]
MRVTGIVAEYNPFHLGHSYHVKKAKEISKADTVIAMMGGNFLQRGEPALVDKWTRTEMALRAGIDLVLELPFVFASRSASWFAQGSVKSLAKTEIITHLAFGAETANLPALKLIAQKLNREDIIFSETLESFLKLGYSYPKARTLTLQQQFTEISIDINELNNPNNVLALAYLRVLDQLNSNIEPVLIKRIGSYHAQEPEKEIASATAIRKLILNHNDDWKKYVPTSTKDILVKELIRGRGPVTLKSFEQPILSVVRRMKIEELGRIVEVTEGIENRLWELAQKTGDITSLLEKIKTKRYTYTRMQRLLIHSFLNFTEDMSVDEPQYLRVLGFNSQGKKLLKLINSNSSLPIITKFSQGYKDISETGRKILDLEIRATDLYNLAFPNLKERQGRMDFYKSPVIID